MNEPPVSSETFSPILLPLILFHGAVRLTALTENQKPSLVLVSRDTSSSIIPVVVILWCFNSAGATLRN